MKRLAIARLWHEGNSFSPVPTTLDDFRAREWAAGKDAQRFYRGTADAVPCDTTLAMPAAGE